MHAHSVINIVIIIHELSSGCNGDVEKATAAKAAIEEVIAERDS